MVSFVYPETLLAVVDSESGSDIHSINERLIGRVLDKINIFRGYSGPREAAAHVLCLALSNFGGVEGYKDESQVKRVVNNTLQLSAYGFYTNRMQFNIPGDDRSDWEHALDRFAEGCFNFYFAPKL
ncbi:hypothetical protein J4402_02810 [Candidatus Pacearchaeota archaeon]|nr:hypothetical protein [Candidatus Pacearchaeota archaeon]